MNLQLSIIIYIFVISLIVYIVYLLKQNTMINSQIIVQSMMTYQMVIQYLGQKQ